MKSVEILGFKREVLGKKSSRHLREEASVPCILYGGGNEIHFHSPMIFFRDLVYTPEAHTVHLNIEGDEYEAILQDIQFHPVSEVILHADFLLLKEDKPVKIAVPVVFEGISPGVQQGGRLVIKIKKIMIKALPKNLPDNVVANISKLELGKSIKVKDLTVNNFEILDSAANPVASVEVPRGLKGKIGE
ncbi:MAG: 50S ribosomal protein L25/general stress protein Ctc [Cytophagia bacterium]|nr:MAG: 50S ribosomal protein L25/general stress protein Ctc [Cytophagales bacterium]TAG05135.1 MAG: 50S ribosomal protein L25/general stress protein Ctc [Cytophagia bacterium]TAG44172.1 MAG: 50S ribosomal protein L25/general stress protein Ctc [Cytophagia bacterium]TAH29560.1 MAG: 50S ribosomal protein L25/general stress protein Ctc [Cytophagales bacterium]